MGNLWWWFIILAPLGVCALAEMEDDTMSDVVIDWKWAVGIMGSVVIAAATAGWSISRSISRSQSALEKRQDALEKRIDRLALILDGVIRTLPKKSQVVIRQESKDINKDVVTTGNHGSTYQTIAATPSTDELRGKVHVEAASYKKHREVKAANASVHRP